MWSARIRFSCCEAVFVDQPTESTKRTQMRVRSTVFSDGARARVGAWTVKSLYVILTWMRTARLIAEHAGLREALEGAPSEWACYRFSVRLRAHKPLLD